MVNIIYMESHVFNNVRTELLSFKGQFNVLIVMLAVKYVIH
jgi:hypothetical protein